MTDTQEMLTVLRDQVDLIVDSGNCGTEPTTVVNLTSPVPGIVRYGLGDTGELEAND